MNEEMRFNKPIEPEEPAMPETEAPKETERPKWRMKIKKQNIFLAAMLLIIFVLIGIAADFYFKAKKLESEAQAATVNEVEKTIEEVGKLIILPEGEKPTVATISDVEKLRSQPFFAAAKNGDKVLIYSNARKAILYDPVKNIIVEVAPLSTGIDAKTQ